MKKIEIRERLEAAIDQLASVEHERWAHWQHYMHSKGEKMPNGSLLIPAHLVAQWSRQIETPYADLTLKERESDKEQVRHYFESIVNALAGQ